MGATPCGFMPWSDGSNHVTQFWRDDDTGHEWATTPPCGSPSCFRHECRRAYRDDLVRSVLTVSRHYRYSTMLTVPHLSLTQAQEAERRILSGVRRVWGGKAVALCVVEPHKSGWHDDAAPRGFHVHALILHNRHPPRDRFTVTASGEYDVRTVRTSSRGFRPGYLLKNYLTHPKAHLARNGGHAYKASRGFFRVRPTLSAPDARKAAARLERSRERVMPSLEDLVDNPAAFAARYPSLSGPQLKRKAYQLWAAREALRELREAQAAHPAPSDLFDALGGSGVVSLPAPTGSDLFESLNVPIPARAPLRT